MRLTRDGSWPTQQVGQNDLQEISLLDAPQQPPVIQNARGTRPKCLKNWMHELLFVACLALTAASPTFLQRSTVVVTASIANDLHMSPAELAWATAGPGLTTGAFLLPFGHIADRFSTVSRKSLLLMSLLVFSALVGTTSLSPNGIVLDIMSSLTGVACAANIPTAVGLLSLAYPLPSRRKNMAFSSFLMGTPAATIIGGLGSGGLARKMGWKAPFVCLAVLYAAIAVLAWFLVPEAQDPDQITKATHQTYTERKSDLSFAAAEDALSEPQQAGFDWLGVFLLTVGVLLFAISLTIGPQGPEPWRTPTVICLLTFGVTILGCFIIWETVTDTPMIPPSVWSNLCVLLVTVCTLFASMAYYSQLFWITMFMQQLDHLSSFDVALRLLPQALVGLLLSPLVGLVLHRVNGTTLLMAAASCLAVSNMPLVFLKQGSNYFAWILPSLALSTIGMDWILNIGSLHVLSLLPLHHHSAGASLLQTAARLGVPFGIATTTAIWSSYDERGHDGQLQVAYTNTFIATAALAGVCVLIAPFVRIGRLGCDHREEIESDSESLKPSATTFDGDTSVEEKSHRPSKRWSMGETMSSTSSILGDRSRRAPSLTMSLVSSAQKSTHPIKSQSTSAGSSLLQSQAPVVWMVCEDCGTRKRERANDKLGDPARYFDDVGSPSSRPKPSRRRFPVTTRQIMTHQMLTKGFDPYRD